MRFFRLFELFRNLKTYHLMIRLGVSLAYGRDDIESLSGGVCIILTSKIGQCSDETGLTITLMILFTACKGSINF